MAATNSSDLPLVGAGTELQIALNWDQQADISTLVDTDFTRLEGYNELPQIGDEVEEEDDTELWQTARVYSSDKLPTPADFEYSYKDAPGDPNRRALLERAQARGLMAFRIIYSTGTVRTFAVRFTGDYIDTASLDNKVMVMLKGKINGAIIKSILPDATA
ncbi:MAG: hypothetical protein KTR20_12845 [Cellvibrionaceae bacterium]|nr:hypothetical protein [Cellvibrionaceae bacterium]